MKSKLSSVILLVFLEMNLSAQYFSKIYDHEPKGQCQHYFVIPQGDSIYVLGDYIDSARTAIRPFRAIFDYEGYRIAFDTLWDQKYKKHFNVESVTYDRSHETTFYYALMKGVTGEL